MDIARFLEGQSTTPIQLDLVCPLRPLWQRVRTQKDHRLDETRPQQRGTAANQFLSWLTQLNPTIFRTERVMEPVACREDG